MAPSSSSSPSSRNWAYDVFPSFGGEDVCTNFIGHFLKELDRKLITHFKDGASSHSIAPNLVQEIRNSRIAVVVLSKNYVSSTWCLDELVEIVRCKQELGQYVIPIFYRLNPSHVRKQTGDFGKMFEKTCKNRTREEKNRWKKALTDVANMIGYHSIKRNNEATMIEEIVNDVLGKLNLTLSKEIEVSNVDSHLAEMSSLLHLESKEVRMIGIWGPSGIGKTTIAKALYNRASRHFQGSVFIDRNLISKSMDKYSRGNSDNYNMKLHLQKELLSKLLGREGIEADHLGAVSERLKYKKVLIVIDDLDDLVVLDALVEGSSWFGHGSRIIVTSKDEQFFRAHGIDNIYKPGFPSDQIAPKMFSRSGQNYLPLGLNAIDELHAHESALGRMLSLPFLKTYSKSFQTLGQGGILQLPKSFAFLHWQRYLMGFTPSPFPPVNLQMQLSKVQKLHMPFCYNLETPPTGFGLPCRFVLKRCSLLKSSPDISTNNFLGGVNSDATSNAQNSIENKRADLIKEENKHGKTCESTTYGKHMSQHQVFINFWGEEVRFSFISHLVFALSTKGVNVSIDKYEKKGEDLEKTFQRIEDSNIALVVFSSQYTESRWCLDELVKIKKLLGEGKLLIIPIFYKVEPSEVIQLDGDFGLKLWNLWKVHRDHRIIKWKDALETVAARMDRCLKENSSESEFITLIVEKVMSRISLQEGRNQTFLPYIVRGKTTRFSAGKGELHESFLNKRHFFGLEQRMKKLEQKLEFDCNETRIIGVVGMAGIGKTTLAMMLHEKWNCKFVRCVPFLDIRKKSEKYSPAWLRKTLLQVLLGGKFGVIKDKMTHESWKEKLLQTKVFVVLDDVSNKKQLEFLLGDLNWIKKGSKIVITSRDKSLIEGLTHDTYLVPPLNNREALQLFSYHTFGDHVFHPTVTSMKPCKELVDCAGGNPLVIKLLSKQFHGRDDARWKMRQGDLTHLGIVILNIFRFSCDELSEKQKDVFLDIACFFRSMDDYFARSLLDSGDHDSESEVKDLTHKGMIAISGCRVEMHDLLYMFGKIFSSQELIGKNGGKSRLWFTQEIFDALINQKDTERIRSIFLDMSEVTKGMVLDRLTFINMPNLRYLKIYDSCCSRQCKALCIFPNGLEFPLENVRYLHWVKYPFEEFPPDFRPENLVDLRLPYSMIERVWQGVKDTPRLKWVDLRYSSKLFNLSALSKAENLMRLNLEGCTNLDELPWEMKNMKSLVYLNMRGCIRLRSLPNMNLIALETLILSDCSNLKEFQVISKSLRVLNLDGTAIKGLPLAIKKLQRLVLLNLKNCKMLESLPNCLGKLKALEELILSGCSRFKNIPDVKHNLKHVQVLLLDGTGVDEMPNISCFTGSKGQASVDMVLKPSGLYASEWPRGFDGVSSLRRLCLGGNDFVSLQDDIGQLYNLTWLDVKQCMKLRSVPILPPRLQYFNAHGCDSLEKVANPLALLKLTEQAHATFNFSNCDKLDQDARNSIISYTRRRSQLMLGALSRSNGVFAFEALTRTCFPGWEVPEWFSNRGSGSLLESQLPPHWCDSRFNGIALCAVILFPGYYEPRNRLLVNCNFEFKNEDGSSTHFSCTVGDWNQLSNTPHKTKSSHVFIGYTSWLDINKHGRYDEEGCFCTKCSLAFQVTDGTEKVLGCEVVECGFNLVYATVERENICWDAKTVVIPKRVKNVPGEDISYGNSRRGDDIQYKSYLGPTLQRDENFLSERKSDALQNLRKSFESKKSDLSKNAGGEVTISSNHLNTPLEDSNTKIHYIWRSCTDQLNERQKNVFLDIACFFRSEDEYFIRSLLDSGDPDSIDDVSEVRDLAQKLLVTICDGRVEMNDPLYTFAKDLGSPEQLRLWKYKDILDKLRKKKDMEASNVRGIFLDMSEVMQIIAMERMTFINMRNLRYLKIYECCCPRKGNSDCKLQFPDGLDFPLKEVRYFHWLKYPLDELPQDFRPENIVDLRLPYSNVEHLWKGVKDTPRLKWVDLSHSSKLVNLSGLAKAESLQRLNVEGCTNLAELPVEMKHMKSLVYLNMRGCIRLRSLPTMDLISLRTLILSDCSNLKDFHVISESLESLHLDGTAIKGLPPTIQKLQRLLLLNLKNCKFLEYLPNSLGKLNSLEELILSGCSRLKNLPDVKHSMKHVQTLLIDGTGVDEMPNISYFIEFEGQSSVDKLLQSIASYCCLSEWPCGVNGISSLQRLCLSGNDFVSLHNDIGKLYNLTWLDVKQCKKLISVPMLPPRLQYLDANGCDSLERVANPLAIQTLTEQSHVTFNFSNCNKLDQDATDAIITYTRWKSELILGALSRYNGGFTLEASVRTCFPGWEVPTWFNHREYGSFLEPKLPPHWCDSKFTGIALCAVILFNGCENQQNRRLLVKCNCEFKNEDGSRIRFSCTVGDQIEPANTFESSHVFIGYASKLDIKKLCEDDEEGCVHTEASFKFQVMDGTKELEGYEVMKCGFSLVYASDDLQVTSGEHGTIVEANRDITSSSWVQDFFGYIFLAFSCVIVLPILSFSVFVIAPQYYLCFSDFCWLLLARILFFVAFGLFLKHGVPRENQSPDSKRNALAKMNLISAIAQIFVFCFTSIRLAMKGVISVNQRNVFRFGSENPRSRLKRRQPRFGAFISRQRV